MTIQEYIDKLPLEDLKTRFVRAYISQGGSIDNFDRECSSLFFFFNMIAWNNSQEGPLFWKTVFELTSLLLSKDSQLNRHDFKLRTEEIVKEHLERASQNVDFKEDNPDEIDRSLITGIEIKIY